MTTMVAKKHPRSRSRTQQRYVRKKAKQDSARPIEPTGNGQGGFMGGFSAGGMM
jgi:predicted lipid-binding transport protein (Tim44 family)